MLNTALVAVCLALLVAFSVAILWWLKPKTVVPQTVNVEGFVLDQAGKAIPRARAIVRLTERNTLKARYYSFAAEANQNGKIRFSRQLPFEVSQDVVIFACSADNHFGTTAIKATRIGESREELLVRFRVTADDGSTLAALPDANINYNNFHIPQLHLHMEFTDQRWAVPAE